MCSSSPKIKSVQAPVVEAPEEVAALVSPEDAGGTTSGSLREQASRRKLRIDLATPGAGSGLVS